MYVKALSVAEEIPPKRKRWIVEVDEVTSFKFFPKNYKELQKRLDDYSSEYFSPLPIPCFDEDYDWEGREYTVLAYLTMRRFNGIWFNVVLSQAHVFIMNDDGDTVDKITVI